MATAKELLLQAGQTEFLLPSGFRVRGVMPSPTEVIRRKLIPWQLRRAINSIGTGRKMSELSEDEHANLVEGRRYQAAALIKELQAPGSDEWEPVSFSIEELATLPPDDLEALDDLIMGIRTAEMITADSEVRLGLRDKESAERVAAEEAGDTVDGWADFRGERSGAGAGGAGGALGDEADGAAAGADPQPAGRAAGGRRSGTATRSHARAGRKSARQEGPA